MTSPGRYWQDMTTAEFAALNASELVAVLPVAAIEQHGPHLPVYVDACINAGILDAMVERMPDKLPAAILPAMPVGKSNEHGDFPGTLTLSAETLIRLWTELAESVARAGVRKLVLFNSHGGQPGVMDVVAQDLRSRLGMFAVPVSWTDLGMPPDIFPDEELRHDIHGGAVETSMMLHLRPDLVQMDKAADFTPVTKTLGGDYDILSAIGPAAFAWQAQDLHPTGAAGNARLATPEKGALLVRHAAERLVLLLQEIHRAPLDLLPAQITISGAARCRRDRA